MWRDLIKSGTPLPWVVRTPTQRLAISASSNDTLDFCPAKLAKNVDSHARRTCSKNMHYGSTAFCRVFRREKFIFKQQRVVHGTAQSNVVKPARGRQAT